MKCKMDNISDTYLIIFFIVSTSLILIIGYVYEKRRTEALLKAARTLGLSFDKSVNANKFDKKYSCFQLFNHGHEKEIKNIMHGQRSSVDLMMFGYQYTIGSGKNSTTYKQTVVSFESDRMKLPDFYLSPENFIHKIRKAFGFKDIDFEKRPDFSNDYVLQGNDSEEVRRVFSPKVLSYFERNKGIYIEAKGNMIIYYKKSKRIKPESIKDFLVEAESIFLMFSQNNM